MGTETALEIDTACHLFWRHRDALGYVRRAPIERAAQDGALLVRAGGALLSHHRRDGQTTIHAIVSETPGTGSLLLADLIADATRRGQHRVVAKCPADLAANEWYARRGFALVRTDLGKHRVLRIWQLDLPCG